MNSRSLVIFAAIAAIGFSACGSDKSSSGAQTSTAVTAITSSPASDTSAFNSSDVHFAQGMIPHHQQAVEMANIALDPAVSAGVKVLDLAKRIKAAQDPEIGSMTGWLNTWGQPMTMETTADTHMTTGTDSGMSGMMSADELTALGKLTGPEFDKTWMEMMTRHHEGAIAMATIETASGLNPDAVALAGKIITAQQAEIAEMKALLGG